MARRPSKSAIQKLIEKWAIYDYAVDRAPVKIQQRLYDTVMHYHASLQEKYPDVDMSSDAFWAELRHRAQQWTATQIARGAGRWW